MIAICAMILPGISGSFILLLLGSYSTVLGAISGAVDALRSKDWDALIDHGLMILIFGGGCIVGAAFCLDR
mgnify:FL=1